MTSPRALALVVGAIIGISPGLANASYIFQNDGSTYFGTHDTEIREFSPLSNFGSLLEMNVDEDDAPGDFDDVSSLLKFGGIFGTGPGQIELGTAIGKATLTLYVSSKGYTINMARMTSDFDESTATWGDDAGAIHLREIEGLPGWGPLSHSNVFINIDVTEEVQAWSDGLYDNFGWAFTHTGIGSNGVTFLTSENLNEFAPKLTVKPVGVDEPATLALFGLGLAGLGFYRRRKSA